MSDLASSSTNQQLLGLSKKELEAFCQEQGVASFHGRQIYRWLYQHRQTDFAAMTNLPADFRSTLSKVASASPLLVGREQAGLDGSLKILLEGVDGARIESVLIPEGERMTACLSSQVGCAVGCKFCATGLMGFKRNLSTGEIIAQLFALEKFAGRQMTNIVMMGMGEPLLNRPALFKAIPILTDPEGVGISRKHFTISTAGWLPGIIALTKTVQEGRYAGEKSVRDIRTKDSPRHLSPSDGNSFPRVKLALSINSTTDEERLALMPLAGRYPLRETLRAAAQYAIVSGERVSVNYLLLAGKNDTDEDAGRLGKLILRAGGKASDEIFKTNLMEYNDVGAEFLRASPERREAFARILSETGVLVTVRTSRGGDIAAACGQLASREE